MTSARVRSALWVVLAPLAVIGVAAALSRTVFPDDAVTRLDALGQSVRAAFGMIDPHIDERPAELRRFDGRYAAHRGMTLLHVIPGGLYLLFAPLQFFRPLRRRYPRVHRWSGRILIATGLATGIAALYFGFLMPFGGPAEALGIALFGVGFIVALLRGFRAIRRGDQSRHREWMIRAFAIAIAISTVRLVAVPLDLLLTPAGVRPPGLFVVSIWTGWLLTIGVAEWWIRATRVPARALATVEQV